MTYRKFTAKTAAAAIAATSTISLTAPVAAQETYTIQRGDELGTIARRIEGVQVGWRDLCSLNSDVIANCDLLEIGTVIALPEGARMQGDLSANGESMGDGNEDAATEAGPSQGPSPNMQPLLPGDDASFAVLYGYGGMPLEFQTRNGHSIEATDRGVLISGHVAEPSSAGLTAGAFIRVSDEFEAAASGNTIRVTIALSSTDAEANPTAAYSTSDVGNSGWRALEFDENDPLESFEYQVPAMNNGNGDYLGIDPDPEGAGQSVTVAAILLEVIDAAAP